MKWIRLHNAGDFDVVQAVKLIGASVKDDEEPIGLYGSGIKFALAQALRQGISVKFVTGGKTYTLATSPQVFRGETFQSVTLVTNTGKKHVTGITTEFGKEDWNDKWFIFREFYSNMLDEHGIMDVVDGIQPTGSGTDVFLQYEPLREYVEDLDNYFTDRDWEMRKGNGRCYKRGVLIGTIDGAKFDFQSSGLKISESRQMDEWYAFTYIKYFVNSNRCSSDQLQMFLDSREIHVNVPLFGNGFDVKEEWNDMVHEAFTQLLSERYVICPNVNSVVEDARLTGYVPFVLPTSDWKLPDTCNHYLAMRTSLETFMPTAEQKVKIDAAIQSLSAFIPTDLEYTIRVMDSDAMGIMGQADMVNNIISLDKLVVDGDRKVFIQTLLHEFNHIITKSGDYARGFPEGYEKFIVSLIV